MCSISGFLVLDEISYMDNYERVKGILNSIVRRSVVRGKDGVGFFSFDQDFHAGKSIMHPSRYIQLSKRYNEALNPWTRVISVHTRMPTTGVISAENSHPFIGKKFALMHNGVVPEFKWATIKGIKLKDIYKVDSESLLHLLERDEKLLFLDKLTQTKYALILLRKRDGKVYFLRRGRPLTFMFRRDLGVMFWSSTEDIMLKGTGDLGEKCSKLWTLPEDVGFKYSFVKEKLVGFDLSKVIA